ncbi:Tetratricopeptide-like helical domain-containing protein [Strongyloides ratti]|uniref:Regulator of microtubule dynamics protein 1 n=1 Tax=Strongyloides ratti TaxID=34506 RepID=A0A090L7M8_STRRB|nr:Tetratricopeptide-like helical domain-containing protein [Strongyloides ratti]CEF63534.1 Tetratricopeptide-like helical domain-containing protein [Strongyloides ratti]
MDKFIEHLEAFENDNSEEDYYEYLNQLKDSDNINDEERIQVNWRLLHLLDVLANSLSSKDKLRKKYIMDGVQMIDKAIELAPEDVNTVKWSAAILGLSIDYCDIKKKCQNGYKFKQLLDKALSLDSNDHNLMHMRGRYHYGVAELSWFEKKSARFIFGTPLESTYEDALEDFLKAHNSEDGPYWIENMSYIGKCLWNLNRKKEAIEYLKKIQNLPIYDSYDQEIVDEVENYIIKYVDEKE